MIKKNYNVEIIKAEEVLLKSSNMWKDQSKGIVAKGRNELVAGFGVSLAMIDVLPTLLYYYSDTSRRIVLDVIAQVAGFDNSQKLLEEAKNHRVNPVELNELRQKLIDCSIGLKYVIRTYEQESSTKKDNKDAGQSDGQSGQ